MADLPLSIKQVKKRNLKKRLIAYIVPIVSTSSIQK